MPLGTTYGSLAYVALYIWNKTGNLHGCASSTGERKEWKRRGAFIRPHKSTFFLFTWTSFIPLISGGPSLEWRKLEIRAGRDRPRILLACLSTIGFEWWQINEIVRDNVTVVTYYSLFLYLIGREKKMSCYTWIRDCKSKRGIVMRNLTQDQVIVFPSNDISHSRGKEWYILKKTNELLQAIQWFQNNLIVYFYDSNIPFPRPIKSRHF